MQSTTVRLSAVAKTAHRRLDANFYVAIERIVAGRNLSAHETEEVVRLFDRLFAFNQRPAAAEIFVDAIIGRNLPLTETDLTLLKERVLAHFRDRRCTLNDRYLVLHENGETEFVQRLVEDDFRCVEVYDLALGLRLFEGTWRTVTQRAAAV